MTCSCAVKCPLPNYPKELHAQICEICKMQGKETDRLWRALKDDYDKGEQHGETESIQDR